MLSSIFGMNFFSTLAVSEIPREWILRFSQGSLFLQAVPGKLCEG